MRVVASIRGRSREDAHGLGLFVRSLVGLDHQAAKDAFADYLDGTTFSASQLHFINHIIDELATNGIMEPVRLYESPFTDLAATGSESMFTEYQVDNIIDILDTVRKNAARRGSRVIWGHRFAHQPCNSSKGSS